MTILITGAAGFIGTNFVLDWLVQSQEPVVNLDKLTYSGNLEALASLKGYTRGFFYESFNQKAFNEATGTNHQFVQDNHSRSAKGVLRRLHYQLPSHAQGKLVRGAVFDVSIDLRKVASTFGQWVGAELSEENHCQLGISPGFTHGFLAVSESTAFLYKTTAYYALAFERTIAWNDAALKITWPALDCQPLLSQKDLAAKDLAEAELFGALGAPPSQSGSAIFKTV